jgi:hypothetical protein
VRQSISPNMAPAAGLWKILVYRKAVFVEADMVLASYSLFQKPHPHPEEARRPSRRMRQGGAPPSCFETALSAPPQHEGFGFALTSSRVMRSSNPKTTVLPTTGLVEAMASIGSGLRPHKCFSAKKSARVYATTSPNPSILLIFALAKRTRGGDTK